MRVPHETVVLPALIVRNDYDDVGFGGGSSSGSHRGSERGEDSDEDEEVKTFHAGRVEVTRVAPG
jgi:hypothetical protein